MTIAIGQIANTDYWYKLINTVNFLSNALSTSVLSVGSNTPGNSGVTNNFFANTFISNYLSTGVINCQSISSNSSSYSNNIFIGNSTSNTTINSTSISIFNSLSNTSLYITTPNNYQVSNGAFFLNANGNFTTVPSLSYPITNTVVTTNGGFLQTIDYWSSNSYNSANYNICVIDNNANNFYSSRISLIYTAGNVLITEYAQLTSNTYIGQFTASTNATSVLLNFTPSSSSTTVKIFREII